MPMSPGYIPFHPNPSKPRFKAPAGAVDAHCHVFGPEASFRSRRSASTRRSMRRRRRCSALRDFLGFDKNVIVQASCHGKDNAALVDALVTSNDKAQGRRRRRRRHHRRRELKELDTAGVKGVRFNFVKRLVDFTPRDVLERIAARIAPLGWHIVVYFEMPDLPEIESLLHIAADHIRVRSHGPARREGGHRRPGLPALPEGCSTPTQHWSKVSVSRALHGGGRRRTTTSCRSRARSSSAFPIAYCGARTGRIPTCRSRRRTTACWST